MKGTGRITLAAVLLAGGESRRMGRDKATIELNGESFWQRQLRVLRRLQPDQIFVSARTAPAWLPSDVELLVDDPPSRGPLSGLTKALAQMRTTHLVALAVDMPFMTADEMARLGGVATEGRGVVPAIGERVEPLAAIYPAQAAVDFQTALRGRDFSLQIVVHQLSLSGKVRLWPVSNARADLYRNANQPGDVRL